ncbi:phosphate acyltransferase PlsX [Marinobacterium rhizophilum]|uniref:Phosphate acyltransferase n=1 Tax=Marinobacterium rhizophilum TaxID=420402 RepID=A0ABY5HM81_9GAMM|nr:phosphate acyltransferase PlsX [Marinobacterium rhizophilum]UTW13516.1 phosphate acyltransferase PlsX [Marinobacterium rhizophilum]
MSGFCTIAIDAMGGDFGPRVTVPATVEALERYPGLTIKLVGQIDSFTPFLHNIPASVRARLQPVQADGVIAMDEKPSHALRKGQNTSLGVALQLVADGQASACVSAGNTGALMVLGRRVLRMLEGIDRPAIVSAVPTQAGHCYMLDLGANVDCCAEHLLQFAIMGSVMTQAVDAVAAPRVGLLNIGQEAIKGNEQVKLASMLISTYGRLNYIGYIEGDDIFAGKADVVVCDGFVGNIALKSSEGVSRLVTQRLGVAFGRTFYRRMLAWLARPLLRELGQQLDPARRNGASLLGLQGIVVKSHGGADRACFGYAIDEAIAEVRMDVPRRISEQLAASLA